MSATVAVLDALQRTGSAPTPPPPPATMAETGLHPDTLAQLMLKTLVAGESSGTQLADSLRLPYSVLDALIQHARVEKLVEVRGTSGAGSAGYRYTLTDLGRDRAMQFFDISRYVGPAPVPLDQYNAYVRAAHGRQALGRSRTPVDRLRPPDRQPCDVRPARSGRELRQGAVPLRQARQRQDRHRGGHRPRARQRHARARTPSTWTARSSRCTTRSATRCRRCRASRRASSRPRSTTAAGIEIRRPVVVVGGELTLEMLDLTFNPIAKFYEAPIQMKANGGVFVVDDFGRQRIPPRDLLNRWIVPLESRVDYLTLHTGRKFEVPFNVFIIFATNLKPESLADEAFLRRIPYKIRAKNPTVDEYTPHLRDGLPQAQSGVRRRDGRVPAAEVLPGAKAPDAGLSSARSGRAGDRHVPLPPARADHHA